MRFGVITAPHNAPAKEKVTTLKMPSAVNCSPAVINPSVKASVIMSKPVISPVSTAPFSLSRAALCPAIKADTKLNAEDIYPTAASSTGARVIISAVISARSKAEISHTAQEEKSFCAFGSVKNLFKQKTSPIIESTIHPIIGEINKFNIKRNYFFAFLPLLF